MSATQSLSIGLGTGPTVPPPILNREACAVDYIEDYSVNWRSPYRPSYLCVQDENGKPACVRRGTYGGAPNGGFAMSSVTAILAPRAVPLYPSCDECFDECSARVAAGQAPVMTHKFSDDL